MKKIYYLIACIILSTSVLIHGANVVPEAGVYYNIIQTPSNMVFGALGTQPVVQTATKGLDQAFEFVPVEGKADTYYIKSFFGKYLNKTANNNWNMIFLAAPDASNVLNAEWVITDDASGTNVFRLKLNANSKYVATDATTTNSYLYCDKAVDHVRGLFMISKATIPTDLVDAYNKLTLGDVSAVTDNLTLPSVSGTANIPVTWTSAMPAVIATDGKVTQPEKYDATVKLTASMSQVLNGVTYTMTKDFVVTVKAKNVASELIAQWDFPTNSIAESNGGFVVTDQSENGFVGTLMNNARIRTIGGQVNGLRNVLDLGNGTGYFDMGTEIGKAIYSLKDYTMCAFFRVDESNTDLNSDGNFIWNFSNSNNAPVDQNGYIIGSLKNQSQNCTSAYWATGDQSVGLWSNAPKGGWHHIAFSQSGTTGTIYIDGVQVAQNTAMTNIPATTVPRPGMSGTLYNWLGRSCYPTDAYLKNTLIYDFQLLSVALNAEDLASYVSVSETIAKLDAAYVENGDIILPELTTEQTDLDLGDLTAVVSNITLPVKGVKDNTVSISWQSSAPDMISTNGTVTRPSYFDRQCTLTATLSKSGQKLTKTFTATVLVEPSSQFASDLIVKYDFATVNADTIVTDAGEKHFTGIVKKNAKVQTIGTSTKYNVLNLGDSIGYFDLGLEIGKVLYGISDYTMSCYYRIDETYTNIGSNGNFLWSFANSTNANTDQNGYIIGILKDQSQSITPGYYTAASGNQSVGMAAAPLLGGWHNMTYTQKGDVGTLYVDGMAQAIGTVTNLPKTVLPKAGRSGTLYNWLGRSCYASDAYLRKTLVTDFRLYKKALVDEEIQFSVLNVGSKITALDVAYNESLNGIESIQNSPYKIVPVNGGVEILGLKGAEKISVFDVAGRKLNMVNVNRISMNAGIYFVKVDNFVAKVVVK